MSFVPEATLMIEKPETLAKDGDKTVPAVLKLMMLPALVPPRNTSLANKLFAAQVIVSSPAPPTKS